MLSVESHYTELKQYDVQVLALCCDNIDSIHAWATGIGGLPFPMLSDFWPHGEVARTYGVFNEDGVPDRAILLIDGEGVIRYIDLLLTENVPAMQPVFDVCKVLNAAH